MPKAEFSIEGAESRDSAHQALLANDFFPLEAEIASALFEKVAKVGYTADHGDPWPSSRTWTDHVILTLHDLGRREGFLVYPYREHGSFKEGWLFDLVWVDAKRNREQEDEDEFDWKAVRGLRLACESEWTATQTAILWDFLKLTVVTADLRVFVYTDKPIRIGDSARIHVVDLCRGVCPLSLGNRYLLIGFPESNDMMYRVDAWTA